MTRRLWRLDRGGEPIFVVASRTQGTYVRHALSCVCPVLLSSEAPDSMEMNDGS